MKKIAALLIICLCIFSACSGDTKEKDPEVCSELTKYKVFSDITEDITRPELDENLNATDTALFDEGYWDAFWKAHNTCKICLANGDVPKEYIGNN